MQKGRSDKETLNECNHENFISWKKWLDRQQLRVCSDTLTNSRIKYSAELCSHGYNETYKIVYGETIKQLGFFFENTKKQREYISF